MQGGHYNIVSVVKLSEATIIRNFYESLKTNVYGYTPPFNYLRKNPSDTFEAICEKLADLYEKFCEERYLTHAFKEEYDLLGRTSLKLLYIPDDRLRDFIEYYLKNALSRQTAKVSSEGMQTEIEEGLVTREDFLRLVRNRYSSASPSDIKKAWIKTQKGTNDKEFPENFRVSDLDSFFSALRKFNNGKMIITNVLLEVLKNLGISSKKKSTLDTLRDLITDFLTKNPRARAPKSITLI